MEACHGTPVPLRSPQGPQPVIQRGNDGQACVAPDADYRHYFKRCRCHPNKSGALFKKLDGLPQRKVRSEACGRSHTSSMAA